MEVGANWTDTVASSKASWKFPNKIISCEYGSAISQLSELESTLYAAASNVFSVLGSCQISEKVLQEHLNFGLFVFDLFFLYPIG